jgi:hypothetical protein
MSHTHSPLRRVIFSILESFAPASSAKYRCKSGAHSRRLNLEPLEERALLSLTLTQSGVATSTIVVAKEPTTAAAYAAVELQDSIKKMTGVTVPITTDDQTVTGNRILVGDSLATEALTPPLSNASFTSQRYTINYDTANTLVLMGHDNTASVDPPNVVTKAAGDPATWVTGQSGFGNAIVANAGDIEISNSGFSTQAGSIEAWVNITQSVTPYYSVLGVRQTDWGCHELLCSGNSLNYLFFSSPVNAWTYTGWTAPLSSGWHHVLMTHDGTASRTRLFVDGNLEGTGSFTAGDPAAYGNCENGTFFLSGVSSVQVDEVRISSTVRAPSVASTEAQATTSATITTPTSLVGYWRLDENTGTTAYDTANAGSTSDNGTRTGGTWTTNGKIGNALQFSGSSQYVTVNNSTDLNITGNTITLACWAKSGTTNWNSAYPTFLSKNNAYMIGPYGTKGFQAQFYIGGAWRTATYTPGSLTITNWNQFARSTMAARSSCT